MDLFAAAATITAGGMLTFVSVVIVATVVQEK
jgi:hypothetical protein